MFYYDEDLYECFNKVDNLTAICRSKTSWDSYDEYELEIGETYKVTFIGVLKSRSDIMLEGFGHKQFNAACFDLYEGGNALGKRYLAEFKFFAPYLQDRYKEMNAYPYTRWMETSAISNCLHDLEKRYGIEIVAAFLFGSRAMGIQNTYSDWDVFYLFNYKDDERAEENKLPHGYEYVFGDDVDTFGYELGECLESLNSSDMLLCELVNQPVLYIADDDILSNLKNKCAALFSTDKAISYYNRAYISPNERLLNEKHNLKELLYYLKGVLSCRWIENEGTMPPNNLEDLVEKTCPFKTKGTIKKLIEFKRNGKNDYEELGIDISLVE